ncbi:unnamed protein product [Rotaria socialis]|uniref:Uncharacterized protein n=1 Tax=Rotaria socialis TaxID=392032 RepID=A0A817QHR8_9BILA|nr:unnamed protein product [Rotaria socialis]
MEDREDTFDKLIFELILSKIWSSQSLFMWNIADDEGATVTGKVGRPSSFEVTINDKLVYSKLDSGHFPAFDKVVEEVKNAAQGRDVEAVTEPDKSSSCSVM